MASLLAALTGVSGFKSKRGEMKVEGGSARDREEALGVYVTKTDCKLV